MAIDRLDHTVVTGDLIVDAGHGAGTRHRSAGLAIVAASTRTVLMVVLALAGILVVLPAAIAAQAAAGI